VSKQHYDAATYKVQASVGYLIKRGHSLLLKLMEPALEGRGFTFVQYQVLVLLRDGIAVNPKHLCSTFQHDSGALTRVIDQLETRGLLERVRRDRDRRKVELSLTAAGREAVGSLIPAVVDKLNLALGNFSAQEFEEFLRLLNKLNHELESSVEPAAVDGAA